jgi:anti-sigma regulatory factor (Ser/Thr protein kinase)
MTASSSATDRIALSLPAETGLRSVATLVLGGIGSRLDLPYERVDDLQLAVLSVLAASDLDRVTIEIEIDDDRVEVSVGPLPDGGAGDRGLRRVVDRLVDGVETAERQARDGSEEWITLRLARLAYERS